MTRLPIPGSDDGIWGNLLNEFLSVAHDSGGSLKSGSITNATVADSAGISQSKIANLISDLAGVMHLSGTETVTGAKNFTGALTKDGNAVVITTDSRLSDARTPAAHAGSHASSGSDPVSSASIGAVSVVGGGKETSASSTASTSSTTISLANGNVQQLTLATNTTLALTGATNGTACSISLYVVQDGTGSRTITWPSSVKWPLGVVPTLSTGASKIDLIILETLDGGTTWYGSLAGADFR